MKTFIIVIIAVLFQQNVQLADAVSCASNPCNLAPGFDPSTGYCCFDIPPANTDSVCTCPNSVASVLNGPCRTGFGIGNSFCNRTCVNGGVCNIVEGRQECWCTLGFSGSFCEIQGIATRCAPGICQAGSCVEKTIGASTFAYCYCTPGWTGITCDQCYFTCTQQGVFPDTAFCSIGRYFYCPQASGAPVSAMCPDGQRFNRATNLCDASYNCT